MSGGKKKASKPSSGYQIKDRTVADTFWNGNNYVTRYNPTTGEIQAMDTLQSAIPQAYADATDKNGIAGYKQRWIDNQVNQLNELADKNLTSLKDKLITGGQVGSSTGWNKIGAFTDSYMDSLNDISNNADFNALNYQNGLLGYANNLQGAMNGYYNLASNTAQQTAQNQGNISSFEKAKRKIQATPYNAGKWINETNPNSEAYKQKANLALMLATLPLGAGPTVTKWGASKLTPVLGKKIGQNLAEGIGAGTIGGGVYGAGNSLIEKENPIVGGLKGAAAGGILGGGMGFIGSKVAQGIKAGQLKKLKDTKTLRKAETNFYKNYIQETSVKRKDLGDINFTHAGLETVSKSPQAGRNFATLKNDIKNANYIREEMPNHPRKDDIVKFHRLEKDSQEFLIGETSDGKKYYMSKLKDGSDGQPSGVGSEPPNNIINDVEKNINPNITKSEDIRNISKKELANDNVVADFEKVVEKLPEDYQGEYTSKFYDDLEHAYNAKLSDDMRAKGDLKKSSLAQNADLPNDMSHIIKKYPPEYEVLHNNDLITSAQEEIAKDPSSRLARLDNITSKNNPLSAQDFEEARQLVGKLYQEGRIEEALALTKKISIAGSKAGQSVQKTHLLKCTQ